MIEVGGGWWVVGGVWLGWDWQDLAGRCNLGRKELDWMVLCHNGLRWMREVEILTRSV